MLSNPTSPELLLSVSGLDAGYGGRSIVRNISLEARRGEIVAIIGHNGAGKSTLFKALFGLGTFQRGEVRVDNKPVKLLTTEKMHSLGFAMLPQGQIVFTELTARENLEVASMSLGSRALRKNALASVLTTLPRLHEILPRRAGTLSGGNRQLLSFASALVRSPRLLMLDEPSLGLQSPLITQCFRQLRDIATQRGTTMLIIEHRIKEVLSVSDRVLVLKRGEVSMLSDAASISVAELTKAYL